jgi:hypothetical protein
MLATRSGCRPFERIERWKEKSKTLLDKRCEEEKYSKFCHVTNKMLSIAGHILYTDASCSC